MSRKGQVAVEYLITYGWAMLVLLAIIAAMFASGIFSPSRFASEECNFQPDFTCSNFILYREAAADKTVLLVTFHNGFGYPINITDMNFTTHDIGYSGARVWGPDTIQPSNVESGKETNVTATFGGTVQPSVGSVQTIEVKIVYKNLGVTPPSSHTMSGRITARVEAG